VREKREKEDVAYPEQSTRSKEEREVTLLILSYSDR